MRCRCILYSLHSNIINIHAFKFNNNEIVCTVQYIILYCTYISLPTNPLHLLHLNKFATVDTPDEFQKFQQFVLGDLCDSLKVAHFL